MGSNVVLQGGPGAGQHTKMANQVAIAGSMLATVESLAYAEQAGLDPRRVLDSIGAGSAASWSLANLAPRILDGNFAPGFYVKHFVKDMRIASTPPTRWGSTCRGSPPPSGSTSTSSATAARTSGLRRCGCLYARDAARERAGVNPRARTTTAMGA